MRARTEPRQPCRWIARLIADHASCQVGTPTSTSALDRLDDLRDGRKERRAVLRQDPDGALDVGGVVRLQQGEVQRRSAGHPSRRASSSPARPRSAAIHAAASVRLPFDRVGLGRAEQAGRRAQPGRERSGRRSSAPAPRAVGPGGRARSARRRGRPSGRCAPRRSPWPGGCRGGRSGSRSICGRRRCRLCATRTPARPVIASLQVSTSRTPSAATMWWRCVLRSGTLPPRSA